MPEGSPRSAAAHGPRDRVPRAITAGMPAAVAISAATTFERIPPDPSGEAENADLQALELLEGPDLGDQLGASRRGRGSAV